MRSSHAFKSWHFLLTCNVLLHQYLTLLMLNCSLLSSGNNGLLAPIILLGVLPHFCVQFSQVWKGVPFRGRRYVSVRRKECTFLFAKTWLKSGCRLQTLSMKVDLGCQNLAQKSGSSFYLMLVAFILYPKHFNAQNFSRKCQHPPI